MSSMYSRKLIKFPMIAGGTPPAKGKNGLNKALLAAGVVVGAGVSSCKLDNLDPTSLVNHDTDNITVEVSGIVAGTTNITLSWIEKSKEVDRVTLSLRRADTESVVISPVSVVDQNIYQFYAGDLASGTPLGIDMEIVIDIYNSYNELVNTIVISKDSLDNNIHFNAPVIDVSGGMPIADYTDTLSNEAFLRGNLSTKSISTITHDSTGGFVESRFELFKYNIDGSLNSTRVASYVDGADLPISFNFSDFVFDAPITGFGDLDPEASYEIRIRAYLNAVDDIFVENSVKLPLYIDNKIWVKDSSDNGPGNKVQGYNNLAQALSEAIARGIPSVQIFLQDGDAFDIGSVINIPSTITISPGYDLATETRTGISTLNYNVGGKLVFQNGATVNAGLIVNANDIQLPIELSGAGTYNFTSITVQDAGLYSLDVDSGVNYGVSSFGRVAFKINDITTVNFQGLTAGSGASRIGGIVADNPSTYGRINFMEDTEIVWGGIYTNRVGLDFQANSKFLYAPLANYWAGVNNSFGIFANNIDNFTTSAGWQVDSVAQTTDTGKRFKAFHFQNTPVSRVINIQANSFVCGFNTNGRDDTAFDIFSFESNAPAVGTIGLNNLPIVISVMPNGVPGNLVMAVPHAVWLENSNINTVDNVDINITAANAFPITYFFEGAGANIEQFLNCDLDNKGVEVVGYHDDATATDYFTTGDLNNASNTTQGGGASAMGNSYNPIP